MNIKKEVLKRRHQAKAVDCSVKGCGEKADQIDELLPFDPVDHDETVVALCKTHQQWADERNALAQEVAEKLREYRRELGQECIDEIQRLAVPEGAMREDVLMGDVQDELMPLSEAIEEPL